MIVGHETSSPHRVASRRDGRAVRGVVAQAASNTAPLARTHSIVVDAANNQVFISGARDDASQSSLFVMNADGTFKQEIAGETDAAGLALDGSSLYVGRCAAGPDSTHGIVDVIDTNTLTVTESIPIALTPNADVGPCNLAIAGGRLWYSPGDQWQNLAAVDLASPHTQHTYNVGPSIYGEQFATSPTDPNLLMVADQDLSGTNVYKYDVSADTPVLAKSLSMFDEGDVGGDGDHAGRLDVRRRRQRCGLALRRRNPDQAGQLLDHELRPARRRHLAGRQYLAAPDR